MHQLCVRLNVRPAFVKFGFGFRGSDVRQQSIAVLHQDLDLSSEYLGSRVLFVSHLHDCCQVSLQTAPLHREVMHVARELFVQTSQSQKLGGHVLDPLLRPSKIPVRGQIETT
jgi:hypothetical protein